MLSHSSMTAQQRQRSPFAQRGMFCVEAVAALVLFLIGVLAIVGLQTRFEQSRSEAVIRAQAAQHAAELVAEMRTTAPSLRGQAFASEQSGQRYLQWAKKLQAGPAALPGAADHPPVVSVVDNPIDNGDIRLSVAEVTVTIYWQRQGSARHQLVTTVRIPDPIT